MANWRLLKDLLSPAGAALLAEAAREPDPLRALHKLRGRGPAALVRLAVAVAAARRRARGRFTRAEALYFLPGTLSPATAEAIANHKAARLAAFACVADLGCGAGGDLLGLARVTRPIGMDRDPARLLCAQANLAAYGRSADLVAADCRQWVPPAPAYHVDPSRRGARSAFAYAPPLPWLREFMAWAGTVLVDIGPLTPERERALLPPHEVEAVSLDGECRALLLWAGELRRVPRRATLLPEGHTLTGEDRRDAPVAPPGAFLLLPDPAVVRAHLVGVLAHRLGAAQVDPHLALLTVDAPPAPTPFARSFQVEAAFPFQGRRVQRELRARRIGHVDLSCHGVRLPAAAVRRWGRGEERRRLFVMRTARGVLAALARPWPPQPRFPLAPRPPEAL